MIKTVYQGAYLTLVLMNLWFLRREGLSLICHASDGCDEVVDALPIGHASGCSDDVVHGLRTHHVPELSSTTLQPP